MRIGQTGEGFNATVPTNLLRPSHASQCQRLQVEVLLRARL